MLVSPLGRTLRTASVIKSFASLPETRCDDRLAEFSVASWDGLTHIDIDAQWPELLDGSTPFDWYFRSPDGESYDQAVERVRHWLDDLHGTVVAISHGLIGRIIGETYLGLIKDDALALPVPPTVIWRMTRGKIEGVPA